jgi:hypothetical protein
MFARAIAVLIALTGSLACGSSSERYCYEMTAAGENNTLVECFSNKGSCVEAARNALSGSRGSDPKNLSEVNFSGCAKMKPWCFTYESTKGDTEVCQRSRERCELSRKGYGFGKPTACKQ